MRAEADAVLIGGETFRKDDPLLTARIPGVRDPKRVILTSRLSAVSGKRIFREGKGEILFVCPKSVSAKDARRAESLGGKIIRLPARRGTISAEGFLLAIGKEGINSLLVEGGGRTAGWLVAAGAVDRFVFFIAPVLLGDGISAVAGYRARTVSAGRKLAITGIRRIGSDLMVTAEAIQRKAP
jgi:diaminohydroxyphosphoribosylaminopyrimidine deaminase/5-amino-6-(5-phosphoribosylamino)uracil reductase